MKTSSRLAILLTLLSVPAISSAQSITREQLRYQMGQSDCREGYRQRVQRGCDEGCRKAAETRRDRCLAAVERRYANALRIQMRLPDLR